MEYIISVGTNMGDREDNLKKCINSLNLLPYTDVTAQSYVYETEPIGYARQENFYNIVLKVESIFEPAEMLGICMGIEAGFGRKRTLRYGPRIIDLDIIFAQDVKIETRNLSLPHPRYHERRFVVEPLFDIFPNGIVYQTDINPYMQQVADQEIKKLYKLRMDEVL